MRTDRALCKNVCLALEVVFLIQNFQRAEQKVRAVIRKRQVVGAGIDKPVFCRKGIIGGIQFPLCLLYGFIGDEAVHLLPNKLLYAVPELYHALDALFSRCVQVRLDHNAVLAVIHLAVHDGVGVVFHIGVCGNRCADLLVFTEVWQLCLLIFTADFLHRFMEQRSQIRTFDGNDGIILPAVLCTLRRWDSKHHFRMFCEVAVDSKAVFRLAEVNPVLVDLNGVFSALQKDDIRNHIGSGVGAERIVGQTNRPQQIRPLCDVLAGFGRLLVHRIAGGHERDHAARTHLIQRFCKKVVVNGKTELVISPVIYLILSERDVAHGEVVKVFSVRCFKARDGNVRLGIKLLGNTSGDAVQLHAVELAALHLLRQQAKAVADAH